jgi:tetratricopeptide (TPR) repeat protein
LAVLNLVVILAAALGCQEREGDLFGRAREALEEDDFERAARLYREVTILAPNSARTPDALLALAQIHYLHLRDVDAASDRLRKILSDYGGSEAVPRARRLLARIYEQDFGDLERALEQYRALLALEDGAELFETTGAESDVSPGSDESRRETLLSIASCLYRLNRLPEAKQVYGEVLALPYHPDAEGAYLRLANVERLAGNHDEALALLRELLARTSREERKHEAVANELSILIESGRFDEARIRLRDVQASFHDSEVIQELSARLVAAMRERLALDAEDQVAALEQEQKRIRWGGGRRARRAQR